MAITDSTPPKVNGTTLPPARFEKFTIPAAPVATPTDGVANPVEAVPVVGVSTTLTTSARSVRPRLHRRAAARVRHVATHPRTRSLGLLAVRHSLYMGAGARVLAKRAWESRTTARHQRMIRTAEELGQHDIAAEWEQRAAQFRAARHSRRMDMLLAPLRLAKALLVSLAIGTGSLFLLGVVMAIAEKQFSDLIVPFVFVIGLVHTLVVIGAVVWSVGLVVGPVLLLLALWRAGQQGGQVPRWVLPERERTAETITPSIVVLALRDLGISQLRKQIQAMADGAAGMLGPITLAGYGVEVDVTLPTGVSTEEIQARRRKLAENLGRHEHEVFITIPTAARTVRLWIADAGALDEPVGPSPLVTDSELTADYVNGRAPWGPNLRGDLVSLSLFQRHLLCTGLSNQGKTASMRALALWLALDPTVEFRIGDLKGVGDWRMFAGLATVLIEGPTDEHVVQVTEMVEAGVAEMERRLQAPPGTKFTPLILIVDEEQVAFMCPEVDELNRPYGGTKKTSRFFRAARKINNQGRAVDVLLWQGTQDPNNQNLPVLVREGAHIRAALALGTESQARMALGDKAIDGGAEPNKLRQGIDRGVVVVAGDGVKLEPGQASITVRTHYISTEEAYDICERAKARRSGVATKTHVEPVAQVDSLQDIADVIGDKPRMPTRELLQRLTERNRNEYAEWTFPDLTAFLKDAGCEPHKSSGIPSVDRQKVLDALADRLLEDGDDYDE